MKRLFYIVLTGTIFLFTSTAAFAVDWTVGVGDYWGNFDLSFQNYKLSFDVDGVGIIGFFSEVRVLDSKLGLGGNYVTGKYTFKGSGTTEQNEEVNGEGERNRKDLDLWLRYSPSRHFSFFGGYKYVAFDFKNIHMNWTYPPEVDGKILLAEADVKLDGFAVGAQTAFGRRLVTVISLSYFPSLTGNVTWDGFTQFPDEEPNPDVGRSTVDSQGIKFQVNVAKPFPRISSAVTLGYYLQVIADNLDSINYKTDELFTGLMVSFSYTFHFAHTHEVDADTGFDEENTGNEMNSSILNSFKTL